MAQGRCARCALVVRCFLEGPGPSQTLCQVPFSQGEEGAFFLAARQRTGRRKEHERKKRTRFLASLAALALALQLAGCGQPAPGASQAPAAPRRPGDQATIP